MNNEHYNILRFQQLKNAIEIYVIIEKIKQDCLYQPIEKSEHHMREYFKYLYYERGVKINVVRKGDSINITSPDLFLFNFYGIVDKSKDILKKHT